MSNCRVLSAPPNVSSSLDGINDTEAFENIFSVGKCDSAGFLGLIWFSCVALLLCRVKMCEFAQWCAWHSGTSRALIRTIDKWSCKSFLRCLSSPPLCRKLSVGVCVVMMVDFNYSIWNFILMMNSWNYMSSPPLNVAAMTQTPPRSQKRAQQKSRHSLRLFWTFASLPFRICGKSKMRTNLRCWER